MYLNHWKLRRRPFEDRFDPKEFFAAETHKRMVTRISGLVQNCEPLAFVAGESGCGKSAVLAVLNGELDAARHPTAWLRATPGSAVDVLLETVEELRHGALASLGAGANSLAWASELLLGQLVQRKAAGQHAVLLVDSADNLNERELHALMCSIEQMKNEAGPVLTAVLAGSGAMLVKARRFARDLEYSVPQWILGSLVPDETRLYITQRVRRAGGDPGIFSTAAVELVHELSGGVPRRINRLCDFSLLVGLAHNRAQVAENEVWLAQSELRLLGSTRTATLPARHRWRRIESGAARIR